MASNIHKMFEWQHSSVDVNGNHNVDAVDDNDDNCKNSNNNNNVDNDKVISIPSCLSSKCEQRIMYELTNGNDVSDIEFTNENDVSDIELTNGNDVSDIELTNGNDVSDIELTNGNDVSDIFKQGRLLCMGDNSSKTKHTIVYPSIISVSSPPTTTILATPRLSHSTTTTTTTTSLYSISNSIVKTPPPTPKVSKRTGPRNLVISSSPLCEHHPVPGLQGSYSPDTRDNPNQNQTAGCTLTTSIKSTPHPTGISLCGHSVFQGSPHTSFCSRRDNSNGTADCASKTVSSSQSIQSSLVCCPSQTCSSTRSLASVSNCNSSKPHSARVVLLSNDWDDVSSQGRLSSLLHNKGVGAREIQGRLPSLLHNKGVGAREIQGRLPSLLHNKGDDVSSQGRLPSLLHNKGGGVAREITSKYSSQFESNRESQRSIDVEDTSNGDEVVLSNIDNRFRRKFEDDSNNTIYDNSNNYDDEGNTSIPYNGNDCGFDTIRDTNCNNTIVCLDGLDSQSSTDSNTLLQSLSPVSGSITINGRRRFQPNSDIIEEKHSDRSPRNLDNSVNRIDDNSVNRIDDKCVNRINDNSDDSRSFISLLRRHRRNRSMKVNTETLRLDSVEDDDWCGVCSDTSTNDQSDDSSDSISVGSLSMLCAERVNQMTKTYNDIEAVSRLLEEKERDLELAARIGQTLLSKNKELSTKNECLDEQLSLANDKVNQLRHDLSLKEELLRFFNEDLEEVRDETSSIEPVEDGQVNVDFLQKKVETLENENVGLRMESANLKTTTACYEEKEKKLVEDCIKQLAEVNCQVETFAEELHHKSEENEGQREQISKFLTQVADLQLKIRKLTVDNMDLHDKLTTSTDSQIKVTKELGKMQDKYDELYEMLEEAHVELQVLRGKHKLRGTDKHHQNAYSVPTDSLASELETSLQQELDQSTRRAQSWKIFETARAAKRAVAKINDSGHHYPTTSSSVRSLPLGSSALQRDSDALSVAYSAYTSDGESMASDGYTADMDSLYGSNQELGRPGVPGSNDLESALRRLALRRDREAEEEDRRKMGRTRLESLSLKSTSPSPSTPRILHSPGGVSTSSSALSVYGYSPSHSAAATFKSSDKLKIMKPLEGSVTLRHWQHLATPHLGGIFEQRQGVQMKGERKLETEEEVLYRLSDYEEDEDVQEVPVHLRGSTPSKLVHSLIDAAVRTPSSSRSRDWFEHQDPRTPSPGLSYYAHSSSSSIFNEKPMQASTPVLNSISSASSVAGSRSTSDMSLGLAALLDTRDSPSLRGSVMRAAVPISKKSPKQEQGILLSSSAAFTSNISSASEPIISSNTTPFRKLPGGNVLPTPGSILFSTQSIMSRYKNLPGSRSAEEMSTGAATVKVPTSSASLLMSTISTSSQYTSSSSTATATTVTSSTVGTDKNSWVFSPEMTGQGFLQQLKNRGYSLYGLWANATAAASSADVTSKALATEQSSNITSSTLSNFLGKYVRTEGSSNVDANNSSSGDNGTKLNTSIGLNSVSVGNHSNSIDLDADDLSSATITTAITSVANSEPGLTSHGGVFGAYTSFRQGGVL